MKKKNILVLLSILAVLVIALALVGCDKAEDLLYKSPENIAYDGQFVTWTKVDRANHYMVSINGGEGTRSNSTTFAYVSSDTFEVTVTAVFDKTEKSTSVTFKPLATIENLDVTNDGEVSWSAIAGANAYSVSVNGSDTIVTDTRITTLNTGSNRVKVKPIVSGDSTYYSQYSAEINVYIYTAPTNVKYDGSILTWLGNSSSYEVTINGVSKEVQGNSLSHSSENKDFTVEIKALGNHTSTYDSKSTTEEYHYLDAVKEIFVEDGIVKWNAVSNAEGYIIMIEGIEQKTPITDTQYANLACGKSQDVAIKPYNNSGNYFSSWSAEKSIYILDAPTISWNNALELDGDANNNLTWDAISTASGYTVRLTKNGGAPETIDYPEGQRAFGYAYTEVGVYTIEVKASASGASTDYYDSKYSTPITVERLAAPKAATDKFIVSKEDNLAEGFTVNFLQVSGASGYQLYKDGSLLEGKLTTTSALTDRDVVNTENISQQQYTYTIRSMGGVKTVSGKTYVTLSCLSDSALSFNITVQATPQNPTMSGYTLSWDDVSGTNGYSVAYAGTTVTAQQSSRDLSSLKAGSYSVTVCARGNGGSTLASNYSTPVAIQRLDVPTNIRITASGSVTGDDSIQYNDSGVLQWDAVSPAPTGYTAYLGSSTTPLDKNKYGDMYQFITTEGTTVSMRADFNEFRENVYYMSSEISPTHQFIRLETPEFPANAIANSNELVWNVPKNINGSGYTPTYQLYYGNQSIEGVINSTKYNISSLMPDKDHTFRIKAVGDDTKYLDSKVSETPITLHKLATPQLNINVNTGKYEWNSIGNANSYYLEIDGVKVADAFENVGSKFTFAPRFTTIGNHTVKLKAIGDSVLASGKANLDSAEFVLIQEAKILETPAFTYKYSNDTVVKGGSIDVTVTTPSANCSGYVYEIAGAAITSKDINCSKVVDTPGEYVVKMKALGGSFDSELIYYIDSLYTAPASITLLGIPTGLDMTLDGTFKWNNLANSSLGYYYQISFDGGEYGEVKTTVGPSVKIANHNDYCTVKIKVWARGSSDAKLISGSPVEYTWTNLNQIA